MDYTIGTYYSLETSIICIWMLPFQILERLGKNKQEKAGILGLSIEVERSMTLVGKEAVGHKFHMMLKNIPNIGAR